jgi:hypothetical protein
LVEEVPLAAGLWLREPEALGQGEGLTVPRAVLLLLSVLLAVALEHRVALLQAQAEGDTLAEREPEPLLLPVMRPGEPELVRETLLLPEALPPLPAVVAVGTGELVAASGEPVAEPEPEGLKLLLRVPLLLPVAQEL